jgi:hypothetical protein
VTKEVTFEDEWVTNFFVAYSQAITFMQLRRGNDAAGKLAFAAACAGAKYIREVLPERWPQFVAAVAIYTPGRSAA